MLRIAFVGDVMLGRDVDRAINENGPAYPWGDTLPVLKKADLRIINLECVISDKGTPQPQKHSIFRASHLAIETLKAAEIDYVSLANNHVLDFHEEAMLDMMERLDGAGIKHAGAGRDPSESMEPAILQRKGLRVGITSIADHYHSWAAAKDKPGTNFISFWIYYVMLERLKMVLFWPGFAEKARRAVRHARENGADLVVYSAHFGPNWMQRPNPIHVQFARKAMDFGADVFHCHSAHIFQGIEVRNGKPIIFAAGDFIDDYPVNKTLRNDWSFIHLLDVDEKSKRMEKLTLVPVHISENQVNLAKGPLSGAICKRMASLCSEMGTKTKIEDGKITIRL